MRRAPVFAAITLILFTFAAGAAAERRTPPPQPTDLTATFVNAGLGVDRLQVYEIGGIVLLRGRAYSKASAEEAGRYALTRGYGRVANLIQVVAPPDDLAIERTAERELTIHRSLDGCRFKVQSEKGVVSVAGTVRHELQRDMAVQLLRSIEGVREVRSAELHRK